MSALAVHPASRELERLWQAYLQARLDAEASHSIHDGIAAGKAWAAWLRAFENRAERTAPNVVALRGRG